MGRLKLAQWHGAGPEGERSLGRGDEIAGRTGIWKGQTNGLINTGYLTFTGPTMEIYSHYAHLEVRSTAQSTSSPFGTLRGRPPDQSKNKSERGDHLITCSKLASFGNQPFNDCAGKGHTCVPEHFSLNNQLMRGGASSIRAARGTYAWAADLRKLSWRGAGAQDSAHSNRRRRTLCPRPWRHAGPPPIFGPWYVTPGLGTGRGRAPRWGAGIGNRTRGCAYRECVGPLRCAVTKPPVH